jgi:Xaa-Pro dipeptidase
MSLYHRHLQTLVQRFNHACDEFGYQNIVIHGGNTVGIADDDQSYPFRAYPSAQQWLPYDIEPDTWIVFSKQDGLTLHWPQGEDFWHVNSSQPGGDWSEDWTIQPTGDRSWLASLKKAAILTPQPEMLAGVKNLEINPAPLKHWLAFDRAYKTDWEIDHLRIANQIAAKGHLAAEAAFHDGLSEYDIHMAYLKATSQQQIEEPYGSIVGLNEAAAILHYEQKQLAEPSDHRTLLIDAGARHNGYASDITRTFTTDTGAFNALLKGVDELQQKLVAQCTIGTDYLSIHNSALTMTAELLNTSSICSLSVEEQLAKKIPQVFFPHGIGHLLGLQVHDVGGHQADREGHTTARPEHAPFLRLLRPLDEGVVITIEPGVYFIPMLLEKMIAETPDHGCDLALIETLKPFGGIRIEDNVVVRHEGPLNLSRASFAELS